MIHTITIYLAGFARSSEEPTDYSYGASHNQEGSDAWHLHRPRQPPTRLSLPDLTREQLIYLLQCIASELNGRLKKGAS